MVFSSAFRVAELEFSRTSLWSVVSTLGLLHHLYQFIKNGSAAMEIDHIVNKNGG